jgi:hypothetical protein
MNQNHRIFVLGAKKRPPQQWLRCCMVMMMVLFLSSSSNRRWFRPSQAATYILPPLCRRASSWTRRRRSGHESTTHSNKRCKQGAAGHLLFHDVQRDALWRLEMATSSSELKKDSGSANKNNNDNGNDGPIRRQRGRRSTSSSTTEKNKTSSSSFPKESVVHRLAQAAARARKSAAAAVEANAAIATAAAAAAAASDGQSLDKAATSSSSSELSSNTIRSLRDNVDSSETKQQQQQQQKQPLSSLASLQDLTRAVDERLRQNQEEASNMRRRRKKVHGDSMTAIIQHNQDIAQEEEDLQKAAILVSTTTNTNIDNHSSNNNNWGFGRRESMTRRHDVAIVLSKPLQRDQLTVEHANRIRRLVRAMMPTSEEEEEEEEEEDVQEEEDVDDNSDDNLDDENHGKTRSPVTRPGYRPNVICFVGHSPGNLVADADAGYLYFQHLCAAQKVLVENIDIHLVRCSVEEGALKQIAFFLQETCVPVWIQAAATAAAAAAADSTTTGAVAALSSPSPSSSSSSSSSLGTSSLRFPKLHLHFTLVSSDYHLCQLHDLHICSPGRSPLRALETPQRSFRTTWSYLYVTTILPTRNHFKNRMLEQQDDNDDSQQQNVAHHQKDASAARAAAALFCAKTYKTTQELVPVLHNLRGVVDNREFFHTDSYQVLVSARRSLVADMESLYREQPHLRAVHNLVVASHSGNAGSGGGVGAGPLPRDGGRPVDVVFEAALLYLGRCLDLVRPAGLFTGMVPKAEWNLARILLEQAIQQITSVCDPDRPIDPSDWGSMGGNGDDGSLVHAGSATLEEMTLLSSISIATSNEAKAHKSSTKGKARKRTKPKANENV